MASYTFTLALACPEERKLLMILLIFYIVLAVARLNSLAMKLDSEIRRQHRQSEHMQK
jgi:hypothetical protein